MAIKQYYNIQYPFSSDNIDELYLDLNKNKTDEKKSEVLHVLFTPKGQKLRDPDFGTDLIKYLFSQNDDMSLESLKTSLVTDIAKYVKDVEFDDISFSRDENDDNSIIVIVHYSVINGGKREKTSVGIKI